MTSMFRIFTPPNLRWRSSSAVGCGSPLRMIYLSLACVLEQKLVVQLSSGEEGAGVLRSRCSGSLTDHIHALQAALAPHRLTLLSGAVPAAAFFRGDHKDVSKLYALYKLALLIKEQGSVLWGTAVATLRLLRSVWLQKINNTLPTDAQLRVPAWTPLRAGCELLSRLPLIRVPLDTVGIMGGEAQSLLLPIIPSAIGLGDAELLEHVQLIKELHDARASAKQLGAPFDAAAYRLLIDSLPPSARTAVQYLIVKMPGGADVGAELGLSTAQMNKIVRRFDTVCSDLLPAAMRDAEASIIADLARRSNLTNDAIVRSCSSRAQLARYRRTVKDQHVCCPHTRADACPHTQADASPTSFQPRPSPRDRCCVTTGRIPTSSLRWPTLRSWRCCATPSAPTRTVCRSRCVPPPTLQGAPPPPLPLCVPP
jgi:hypothetical protein